MRAFLPGEMLLGRELGHGVDGQRVRGRGLVEEPVLRAVDRAGRKEDDPAVVVAGEPADGLLVDRHADLGMKGAGRVAHQGRQPDHRVGPAKLGFERLGPADIAVDEIDRLPVGLLVQKGVEDPRLVSRSANRSVTAPPT